MSNVFCIFTSFEGSIVSVKTSSFIDEFDILVKALPDNTPCTI